MRLKIYSETINGEEFFVAQRGKLRILAKDLEALATGIEYIQMILSLECMEKYQDDYDEGDFKVECYEIEEEVEQLEKEGRLIVEW